MALRLVGTCNFSPVCLMKNLRKGEVAVIEDPHSSYNGEVVIKSMTGVVITLGGIDAWGKNSPLTVRRLEEGTTLTFEVA